MSFRIRSRSISALRKPTAFATSAMAHVVLVLYLIAISTYSPDAARRSLYDQEIRPHEHQLIWYNLETKLPAIRRADAAPSKAPPRATQKAPQRIVSAHKDDPKPAQKIWVPDAPKIEPPKPAPLPNLLAIAPTAPTAPAPPPPKAVKKFVPPAPQQTVPAAPPQLLPDAPKLAETPAAIAKLNIDLAAPRRTTKRFTPAAVARAQAKTPSTLDAPPPVDVALPPTPGASATLAIVGLDPAKSMKIPEPPAPRDAGFSAGPKPNPKGSDSVPAPPSAVALPDLAAASSDKNARAAPSAELSPAARQNLLTAMRMGAGLSPTMPLGGVPRPAAPRVSSSPDPRMAGRDVYTMAIQMPNVTSFSGSWLVWFAERNPLATERHASIRPPDPIRKVDPKYMADAVREGIEGVVRLTAVIRKDGTVDDIGLLKHLDARLDSTAQEALGKWRFTPATRDGEPVDVDAVFEVPFRLPPKETR